MKNEDITLEVENLTEEKDIKNKLFEDEEDLNTSLDFSRETSQKLEKEQKDIITISEKDWLQLKNYNLQTMLADKNIENLELKKTILVHEKKEVLSKLSNLRKEIADKNNVSITDYLLDLPNKRIIHKRLVKQN